MPPWLAGEQRTYSEETAREIDCALRDIIEAALARARSVLDANRDILEACAAALLERETLDEATLKGLAAELKRVA